MRFSSTATTCVVVVLSSLSVVALGGCGGDKPTSTVLIDGTTVTNTGNGSWTAAHPDAVTFELEQVFGVDEDPEIETLAQPSGVAFDSDRNVYIVDSKDSRIISFTKDGVFRWESGREGDGPGELSNAWDLSADSDGLYLTNVSGSRVDHFSFDGTFVETTSILHELGDAQFVSLAGFTEPRHPVFAEGLMSKFGMKVTSVDATADPIEKTSFEIDLSSTLELPDYFAVSPDIAISNGLITRGHYTLYEHAYYEPSGTLLRTVTRDFNEMVPPVSKVSGQSAMFQSFGKVGAPVGVGNDLWLSVTDWPTNLPDPDAYIEMERDERPELVYAYMVDLFDNKGELLWSKRYEGESPLGGSIAVTDGDKIYAYMSTPFPQVRRYRIVVRRP